jgi:hypothetical protein
MYIGKYARENISWCHLQEKHEKGNIKRKRKKGKDK